MLIRNTSSILTIRTAPERAGIAKETAGTTTTIIITPTRERMTIIIEAYAS